MANIDENFVVKTGLTVGPTTITASTGNVQVGGTVINGTTGDITVGSTVINGTTGAISTNANVTTQSNFIVGSTVLSPSGAVSTSNIIATGGTLNNVSIGGTTASSAYFTTVDATGTVTTNDILPHVTNVSNIGSATQRFQTIFVNEARLSVNTLFLGDTPILGTSNNVINIHADAGQAIHMQASGAAGTLSFVANAQVTMQTTGNNADVLIQSNGTGAKTRLLSGTEVDLTAPTIVLTGNVTTTGGGTVTGDLLVSGNLTVGGSTAAINASNLSVKDSIVTINAGESGTGVTSGATGLQFDRGSLSDYQLVFQESDDTLQFGAVGATTKVAVFNSGNTTITADITGAAATATTAGTVTTAAQPAITSVGTLTSLAVTNGITAKDVTISGNLVISGTNTVVNATELAVNDLNITVAAGAGSAAAANGAGLTVAGAGATLVYGNANDNFTFNKRVDATIFYGSGAGLTSVPNGALANSAVTVTAGTGMSGGGSVSLGGSVTLTNAGVTSLTGGGGVTVSGATGAVTLGSTATSANTASAIVARDISGNFTAGTITAALTGTASKATHVAGGAAWQVHYQSAADTTAFVAAGTTGQILTATTGGAPTWATRTTVDSLATSGVGISVNQASGAVTLTSNATALNTASTIVARDISGNFAAGVITATSTNARYADLAENYSADAEYAPGTVVEFGGDAEVTLGSDGTRKVAGVVTTNPAYLMNVDLAGVKAAVALQGRVPCKVKGKVSKGDMLVSAGGGYARAEADPKMGQVIGKSLDSFDGAEGVIEVVVGRM